jgi:hypothetical protein
MAISVSKTGMKEGARSQGQAATASNDNPSRNQHRHILSGGSHSIMEGKGKERKGRLVWMDMGEVAGRALQPDAIRQPDVCRNICIAFCA